MIRKTLLKSSGKIPVFYTGTSLLVKLNAVPHARARGKHTQCVIVVVSNDYPSNTKFSKGGIHEINNLYCFCTCFIIDRPD